MTEVVPALYDATVRHTRRTPLVNSFRYRTSMSLVDLDALPRGFRPRDHVDVRRELAGHGLSAERILMLANARVLGYIFNPISIFWCYDPRGELVATVAEVHNTYGDRHAYVLRPDGTGVAEVDKALYVSPFYPVDGRYSIRISEPGAEVSVAVTLRRDSDAPFVATLRGSRRPRTLANRALAWLRYPWAPLRVTVLIRRQGIRLWRRGLEVQPR